MIESENWSTKTAKTTMQKKIWKMILIVTIPLMLIIILVVGIGLGYGLQYNSILNNVTTASDFNRDFTDNIKTKMYYFVIDSQYSEGMPTEEVKSAEAIALKLIETTAEKDSLRAINSVLNLCHNLEDKMQEIAATEGYDSRMSQLNDNIYVMADLIQEYMYTYLYYEAVHLDALQSTMITNMVVLMGTVVVLALALLFFLLSYSRKLSKRIVDPIDMLCERLVAIGRGGLLVCEPIQADVEEVQLLSDGIESMVGHLKRLIERNTEQEKQRRRTELALLQAQINPHFLYNTLDTIIWLIESGEISESVAMVSSLSNFFRFSLSRGQNVITIQEEQQHIRSYLEIQHMRYRDLMEYDIDIPEELSIYILPKLTLQPLVENALYHGIKIRRRKGLIRVSGRVEGEQLVLEVADDGCGMTPERLEEVRASLVNGRKEGFGLRTVHQRIQILFGSEYGLTLESEPDVGTRILVRIPMQTSEKEMGA
ncbi:MAG: sensor histidine kinase [Christensenella sp.]|nr:sensor histidine kinase [Christensenella sp.]